MRRPGYYVFRFQSHHFVRYWDGQHWLYAEGGSDTGIPAQTVAAAAITRIVQP